MYGTGRPSAERLPGIGVDKSVDEPVRFVQRNPQGNPQVFQLLSTTDPWFT